MNSILVHASGRKIHITNESGRKIHITVDKDDEFALPLRYNMVISKDALDRKRHLESLPIPSKQWRLLFALVSPYNVFVDNRLPNSYWGVGNDEENDLTIVVVDDVH